MKFRIIATLLVILATVVLLALFGGNSQEATDAGASPAPQAGEFNMDSINSMRK